MSITYLNKLESIYKIYSEFLNSETGSLLKENIGLYKHIQYFNDELYKIKQSMKKIKENEIHLNIGIFGSFNAGKSSIINSIIGDTVLVEDVSPSTALVTILKYGNKKKIRLFNNNKSTEEITEEKFKIIANHSEDAGNEDCNKSRNQVDHIEICYPSDILRNITLIDTPGFSSISEEDDKITKKWIEKVDVLLWTFDINKGAIHKDEIDILNDISKKIGSKWIIAILNKADTIPPTDIYKLYNGFNEDFKFHFSVPYSAKAILKNIVNQKVNKEIMDDLVLKLLGNLQSKEERELKVKKNKISFIVNDELVDERKFEKIQNYEYLNYNCKLKEYLLKLHKEKKVLKGINEEELEKKIEKSWHKQNNIVNDLHDILISYKRQLTEEGSESIEVIGRFEIDFTSNFKSLFKVIKGNLYRKISNAFIAKQKVDKINGILDDILLKEFYVEIHDIVYKFIAMNEFKYDFEDELIEIKFYLEQLIIISCDNIKGISQSIDRLNYKTLEILIPDEIFKNILFEFYKNVFLKLKDKTEVNINEKIQEVIKFIYDIEKYEEEIVLDEVAATKR
ncbi:dynamin family protein [Clostridium sp.]|uniref:dynamin family protein n=1 Tax=Clostridium sp. TaxID=1506 RepID=UPI003D6D54BC